MISKQELEQVREINRKLPFAAPIEQGLTLEEFAESVGIYLLPQQVTLGEAMLQGEVYGASWPRRGGKSFTREAVQRYVTENTDDRRP